ncbi:MAG: hypothetical protein AAGG01_10675 [Planctomycetota bacterium]
MPIRRILNALRLFFLAVCVAAVGARVAWTRFPEQVERVDNWVVKTSEHRDRRELSRAAKAKEENLPDAAREHLLNVAEMTEGVKHGDRLEGLRQQALGYLRDAAAGSGDDEEALKWANELHRLSDLNTPNELARAKLLARLGMYDESIALFERLVDLGQGRADYNLPYFKALVAAGRGADALQVLLMMEEGSGLEPPLGGWEFRSRVPGTPWSDAVFMDLATSEGSVTLGGEVAAGIAAESVTELRLDLPRGASVLGRGLMLTLVLSDGSAVTLKQDAVQRLNQLAGLEDGDGFRALAMSDPYIVLNVPELPEGEQVMAYRLEISLVPVLPDEVAAFLESDAGAAAIAEVEQRLAAPSPPRLRSMELPWQTDPLVRERARLDVLKEAIRG